MGAPLKLRPTQKGKQILAIVIKRYGSIQAAARAADISEATLRKRIYGQPASIAADVRDALEKIGIPRKLLSA